MTTTILKTDKTGHTTTATPPQKIRLRPISQTPEDGQYIIALNVAGRAFAGEYSARGIIRLNPDLLTTAARWTFFKDYTGWLPFDELSFPIDPTAQLNADAQLANDYLRTVSATLPPRQ